MKKYINKFGFREITIIILVAVAVILFLIIAFNIGKRRNISDPLPDLRYYLKQRSYYDIYSEIKRCNKRNYEGNEEYEMYVAIADYYTNSMAYKAHLDVRDGEEEKYAILMEKAKANMGELSFAADDIDKMLLSQTD